MRHPVLGRAWGGGWRFALGAAAALPVVSLFVARGLSPVSLAAALLFVLAALRPSDAWLAVAVVAPLGAWMGRAIGFGTSLTGPVVLAFLAGWLAHEAVRAVRGTSRAEGAGDHTVRALLALLGVTVLASLLVRLATHHLTVDFPAPYARALFHYLWHDYFGAPSRFRVPLVPAVRLLAGIALAAASLSLARRDPRLGVRGAAALAAGAGAAALVSLVPLAAGTVSIGWSSAFPKGLGALRLSSVGPDVNAAGSFYVLALGAAAGLAFTRRPLRWAWGVVVALVLAALWMTGSRAALAAPALAAALAASQLRARLRGRPLAVAGAAAAGLVVLLGAYLYATASVRTPASVALEWRIEHGTRALRMFADHPVFGAGVGRFYAVSRAYASPGWPRPGNSHNNFLQVLAELGLVGLALLAGLVGAVLWRAARDARSGHPDPLPAFLAGGVLAFVLTWLAGHPLLVFEVAVPFWLALGLVAGLGKAAARPPAPWRRALPVVLAAAMAISVIPRARAEIRDADLSGAGMGFSSVHADARGHRFRWMAGRARLFVPASAREVVVSFRSPRSPAAVKILVDGRRVARVLAGPGWTDAVFELPHKGGRSFVPLDLRATVLRVEGAGGSRAATQDRIQVGLPLVLR